MEIIASQPSNALPLKVRKIIGLAGESLVDFVRNDRGEIIVKPNVNPDKLFGYFDDVGEDVSVSVGDMREVVQDRAKELFER